MAVRGNIRWSADFFLKFHLWLPDKNLLRPRGVGLMHCGGGEMEPDGGMDKVGFLTGQCRAAI